MSLTITQGYVLEDSAYANMARLVDRDGELLTQAAVSAISLTIFTKKTGVVFAAAAAVSVASTIFDTLQTPDIWTKDSVGYNFRHDGNVLTDGDTWYRFEYKFTPVVGGVFHVLFDVLAKGIWTT